MNLSTLDCVMQIMDCFAIDQPCTLDGIILWAYIKIPLHIRKYNNNADLSMILLSTEIPHYAI